MPIYDFYCEPCDLEFEKLVFRRDQEVLCPKCDSSVKKRPSRFAIRGTRSDGSGSGAHDSCTACTSSSCSNCSGG